MSDQRKEHMLGFFQPIGFPMIHLRFLASHLAMGGFEDPTTDEQYHYNEFIEDIIKQIHTLEAFAEKGVPK